MNKSLIENMKALRRYCVTCCKKMRVTSDEVWEAKSYLPLFLIMWIPQTLAVAITLWYHIRWQYFGITEGINPFYTNRFKTSWDSYMWIVGEIGWVGMGLFCIIAIGYLWMTRKIVIALFYRKLECTKTDEGTARYFRPKSLQGIENNNGWIKIESEDELPKGIVDVFIFKDGIVDIDRLFNKKFINNIGVTHYQPIEKPKQPNY